MREEKVPAVPGERRGNPSKDSDEVVLEGSNSAFCAIASVYVGWHQLVFAAVVGDGLEEGLASFIVQDVDVRGRVVRYEAAVEIVVCRDSVAVVLRLERAHENCVGFTMQCHHDVLVATACPRCEASRIIGEEVVDRDDLDVDGWCGWLCWG